MPTGPLARFFWSSPTPRSQKMQPTRLSRSQPQAF